MSEVIAGIRAPDSAIARAATQLVRDTEDDLLYNHSRRVFFWGALTGERRELKYDPELLYLGAMFNDMGLTKACSSPARPCLHPPYARSELRGKYNRSLRQRHQEEATDHVRQRQSRRAGAKDPNYQRMNFCSIILGSAWPS